MPIAPEPMTMSDFGMMSGFIASKYVQINFLSGSMPGSARGRAGGGRRAGDSKGNRLDLTLNVIMLLHPIEAIELWQQAAAHAGG